MNPINNTMALVNEDDFFTTITKKLDRYELLSNIHNTLESYIFDVHMIIDCGIADNSPSLKLSKEKREEVIDNMEYYTIGSELYEALYCNPIPVATTVCDEETELMLAAMAKEVEVDPFDALQQEWFDSGLQDEYDNNIDWDKEFPFN